MRISFQSITLLTVFATLGWPTFIAKSQELTPEMHAQINQLVNIQRNWGTKLNSPGATLQLREIKKFTRDGVPFVDYEMYATGLPHDRTYELTNLVITMEARKMMSGISFDKDGRAICAGQVPGQCGEADKPDDPIDLILSGLPGEPLRLSLISDDGNHRAFISAVPNPISNTDHGCQINVVRITPKFELALVEGTGFPLEAEIEFHGDSMGEIQSRKIKTDKTGYTANAILPSVKGKTEGTHEAMLVGPKCKPKVKFHWGSTSE